MVPRGVGLGEGRGPWGEGMKPVQSDRDCGPSLYLDMWESHRDRGRQPVTNNSLLRLPERPEGRRKSEFLPLGEGR